MSSTTGSSDSVDRRPSLSCKMELDEDGQEFKYYPSSSPNYTPFFPNSVNLISACTSSGKSSLVIDFIKNRETCFVRKFKKVLVVLCNDKVSGSLYRELSSDSTLKVEFCDLVEFVPEQWLDRNCVVVFEDVSVITDPILESVNVLCHHLNLNSIFIIAQSIFVNETFKNLISLVHRLILFFSGGASKKVSKYIRQLYFVNQEIKDCFKSIESYAEKHRSVVLFELNDVNGRFQRRFFAIVNFDVFFKEEEEEDREVENSPAKVENPSDREIASQTEGHFKKKRKNKKLPTIVFPKLMESSDFERSFSDNSTGISSDISDLPPNSFVLVPAKNVVQLRSAAKRGKKKKKETDKETIWNSMSASVEESIVNGLKYKNQQPAKNIARNILSSKFFVISSDGKSFKIKGLPNSSVSMLDYLGTASRAGGPKETDLEPLFYKITDLLVQNKTPKIYFKNKHLLKNPENERKGRKKKIKIPPPHSSSSSSSLSSSSSKFSRRF